MGDLHSADSIRKIAADAGGPPSGTDPEKEAATLRASRITGKIADKVKNDPKKLELTIQASELGKTGAERLQTRIVLEDQKFSVMRLGSEDDADYRIGWANV